MSSINDYKFQEKINKEFDRHEGMTRKYSKLFKGSRNHYIAEEYANDTDFTPYDVSDEEDYEEEWCDDDHEDDY